MDENRKRVRRVLMALIILAILTAAYFWFFYSSNCKTNSCFLSHQEKCSRAKYIYDSEDATWNYKVLGKSDGKCEVEVGIIQIKQGDSQKQRLEGKSMVCSVALGDITISPYSDLSKCHGTLREEMQQIMLEKAHSQILANIGSISEDLKTAI